MSLGPRGEALRRRVLSSLPLRLWLWRSLPLAAFAGLRIQRLDGAGCTVHLPGGWRTRNPFRSTYFAAQSMAAEMSTGAPATAFLADQPASIAMLVVGLRASYSRRIVGESVFSFEDGAAMKAAIERAATSDEPQLFTARAVGRDGSGEVCSEFEVTWSFRRRGRG